MEKEISNNLSGQDSAELLESLGFTITDRDKITYSVIVPDKWTVEDQGQFHTVFDGPNGESLISFIKRDPWDRNSWLTVSGV